MPLIIRNGLLLRKGSQLAASLWCCCGSTSITACTCTGSPVTIPKSITVEVTLGALFGSNGTCTHADATGFIEGTYVLPYVSKTSTTAFYQLVAANGISVGFTWACSPGAIIGFGETAEVSFGYCVPANSCFCRISSNVNYFGPPGSSITSQVDSLCNITTGSTTPFSYTGPAKITLEQGPIASCGSPQSGNYRQYSLLFTCTPSW